MDRVLIPLRILGIPLLLLGIGLAVFGARTLFVDVTGSVDERQAVVEARRTEQRRVSAPRGGQSERTVVLLRVAYDAGGQRHSVEREVPRNTEIGRAQVGSTVTIYTRRHDPSDVLVRKPDATHGLMLLTGAAFMTLIGAIGTLSIFFRKDR